jgi:hypothetical protein
MRLMVIGDFRWDSGSSHVIREYARHAPAQGIEIAVSSTFGSRDEQICRDLPYIEDLKWATHLLIVFEGNPFLKDDDLERIDRVVPKSRRAVVDADGHWGSIAQIGEDNNTWPCGHEGWQRQIAEVSDLVLQPALFEPCQGAVRFPYFGMPSCAPAPLFDERGSHLDMQYIGCNWFRFRPLVEVFSACREALGKGSSLRVRGRYWDGKMRLGFESGTKADIDLLKRLDIEVLPPVPFGQVVERMGDALITPVLVRPVLAACRLMTPRMLETVSAATIPVYRQADRYIGDLYQDDGELCLGHSPADKLKQIVQDQVRFRAKAHELRHRLYREYSYSSVLGHLKRLLN